MTIAGISSRVQTLLTNMKNASNTGLFVTVQPSPEADDQKFAGYPSATHFYLNTENDFATVSQNRRVYEYHVFFYVLSPDETESQLWTRACNIMDALVAMFDKTQDLSDASLNLTPGCDILRPAPGSIVKTGTPNGEGLVGEITLFCTTDVAF